MKLCTSVTFRMNHWSNDPIVPANLQSPTKGFRVNRLFHRQISTPSIGPTSEWILCMESMVGIRYARAEDPHLANSKDIHQERTRSFDLLNPHKLRKLRISRGRTSTWGESPRYGDHTVWRLRRLHTAHVNLYLDFWARSIEINLGEFSCTSRERPTIGSQKIKTQKYIFF